MQYYLLVNTASPKTGLLTVGEVLTEQQAEALGPEKISELLQRRVLAPCRVEETPDPPADGKAPDETESAPPAPTPDAAETDENEDEEPPELDMENLVEDGKAEAEPEDTGKGRRKKA